jgi:hypothetical protein
VKEKRRKEKDAFSKEQIFSDQHVHVRERPLHGASMENASPPVFYSVGRIELIRNKVKIIVKV